MHARDAQYTSPPNPISQRGTIIIGQGAIAAIAAAANKVYDASALFALTFLRRRDSIVAPSYFSV